MIGVGAIALVVGAGCEASPRGGYLADVRTSPILVDSALDDSGHVGTMLFSDTTPLRIREARDGLPAVTLSLLANGFGDTFHPMRTLVYVSHEAEGYSTPRPMLVLEGTDTLTGLPQRQDETAFIPLSGPEVARVLAAGRAELLYGPRRADTWVIDAAFRRRLGHYCDVMRDCRPEAPDTPR